MKDHTIALVVAAAENNAIGKNNQLLWHLPKDLRFFKNITWGGVVIMGRKTYESVNKPLPGRLNIVITGNKEWKRETVLTASGLDEAIELAKAENFKEISVIGGGEIYKQAMPIADIVHITRVHASLDGDTFFPEILTNEWELISKDDVEADDKHRYSFSFEKWQRKK
jgi:dihydrofolate reductase